MSDRLTAEPGTTRYFLQLLAIAQKSDHPMDKLLTIIIPRMIEERRTKPTTEPIPSWLLNLMQEGEEDKMQRSIETASEVWKAWNDEHTCFANCMCRLRDALLDIGVDISTYEGVPNPRLYALAWGESLLFNRRKRSAIDGNKLIWSSIEGQYLEVNSDGYLVR